MTISFITDCPHWLSQPILGSRKIFINDDQSHAMPGTSAVNLSSLRRSFRGRVVCSKNEQFAHSMALEEQAVIGPLTKLQFDLAVKELLGGSRRKLW